MNVNEVLKKRYGGDRFNPVAGQSQMSFQEWMDRHPSLQGAREGVARDKYQSATSEAGGRQFLQGVEQLDGPVKPPEMFDSMQQHKGFGAARPNMEQQMGGPDQPPRGGVSGVKEFANRSRSEKMMGAAKRRGMTTTGAKGADGPAKRKPAPSQKEKVNVQKNHEKKPSRLGGPPLTGSGNGSKMVNYNSKKRGPARGNR